MAAKTIWHNVGRNYATVTLCITVLGENGGVDFEFWFRDTESAHPCRPTKMKKKIPFRAHPIHGIHSSQPARVQHYRQTLNRIRTRHNVSVSIHLPAVPVARPTVLFFSRPRSEGWPHHGRTFSIYPCPLSFRLTLPRRVLSTSWCCPSRPCVAFLAFVHLALFLALSLSPGHSLVSSLCDHSYTLLSLKYALSVG